MIDVNLIDGAFKYVGSDMKIWTVKKEGKLFPANVEDQVKINKLPAGEPIMIKFTKVRNPEFHRKYWALVNLFLQNLPEAFEKDLLDKNQFQIKNKDDAHFYIKLKTGYVEKKYVTPKGDIAWAPKSISFDSMDDMEFQEFYDRALDVVCSIIGIEESDAMTELMNFM